MKKSVVFSLALTLFVGVGRVFAWGCEGHEAVALIAESLLPPAKVAAMKQLLASSPADPAIKPYCVPPIAALVNDPIAEAATWADDYRAEIDRTTAPWHFIDFPIVNGKHQGSYKPYCPGGNCVIDQIVSQYRTLVTTADATLKANALRFVLHFIGDLHQPLHATTNGDRGGNCVPVTLAFSGVPATPPTENPRTHIWTPNLHGAWDSDLIRREMTLKHLADARALADYVVQQSAPGKVKGKKPTVTRVRRWADESVDLTIDTVYRKLPVKVPLEAAGEFDLASCDLNNNVGARFAALHETIDDSYLNATAPVIVRQIRLAGERLAEVLMTAF